MFAQFCSDDELGAWPFIRLARPSQKSSFGSIGGVPSKALSWDMAYVVGI